MMALPLSEMPVKTVFEILILLHSFSVSNLLIKGKAVKEHILPATGNKIGFAAEVVARASTAFARAAEEGSVAQLMVLTPISTMSFKSWRCLNSVQMAVCCSNGELL